MRLTLRATQQLTQRRAQRRTQRRTPGGMHTRRPRPHSVTAGMTAALAALALSACGTEDTSDAGSPPTAVPADEAQSGSPAPTDPTEPTAPADSPSPASPAAPSAGAKEVVKEWLRLWETMRMGGDSEPFSNLSSNDCSFCAAALMEIHAMTDAGGHIEGGHLTVSSIRPRSTGGSAFTVKAKVADSTVWDRAGAAPRTQPGGRFTYTVTLEQTEDGWKVRSFTQDPA